VAAPFLSPLQGGEAPPGGKVPRFLLGQASSPTPQLACWEACAFHQCRQFGPDDGRMNLAGGRR
jgi:hypothetical protein